MNKKQTVPNGRQRLRKTEAKNSSACYAELIFGGMIEVKRLYVKELKRIRVERGFSPEQVDKIVALSLDWPRTRLIESNSTLFTLRYHQALTTADFGQDENPFLHVSYLVEEKIVHYLSRTDLLQEVLEKVAGQCLLVEINLDFSDLTNGWQIHERVRSLVPIHIASGFILVSILEKMGNAVPCLF